MIELNSDVLTDAFSSCYGGFNRSIAIVFNNKSRYIEFINSLRDTFADGKLPGVKTHWLRGYDARILFDTGSKIEIIFLTPYGRGVYGMRVDKIIYDESIVEDSMLFSYLKASERYPGGFETWEGTFFDFLGSGEQADQHADCDELSEFLGSFGVYSKEGI